MRDEGVNNHLAEMCSSSEAVSYLRLIDSCITQLKAQGPSRTCNESKKEEEDLGLQFSNSACRVQSLGIDRKLKPALGCLDLGFRTED